MSSDSSSDADSNRSGTPAPIVNNHKSRSGSPVSNRSHSGSRSRSPSAGSGSQASNHSRKSRSRSVGSHSGASNRSASGGSQRSGSRGSKRSGSGDSKRSGSGGSRRSRSGGSKRSESGGSKRSGSGGSRRSGSGGSKRSGSGGSRRSVSAASRQSGSPVSKRSGSAISRRSGSAASRRSASGSSKRSGSPASNRSGSPTSKKSRSRSGSAASNRSRSKSAASNRSRSRSRSKTPGSNRSGSGSRRSRSGSSNRSRSAASNKSRSRSRSGSISQNLQIDEPRSPGDKRKGSEEKQITSQKKSRVIDSDSEDDDNGDKGVSAAAIFGDDADDISSEEEKEKAGSEKEEQRQRGSDDDIERVGDGLGGSDEEIEQRNAIEDDEDKENEPEVIPETRIDVEIPKISCNLGKDINFVKLPNFLSVETRPFDPETYEDEIDEEETLDEEGRARLKLKVENTIRWRDVMDDEGNVKKESNARIIKWSDGSYSLHLGSEIFDVYRQPLQGDHNHLFIRQGTGLQGQAVFRTKLSFRPHSTESFTHRKMTLSLADRSQKTSGIKILSQVGVDPDHDKAMRIKKEEEKLRQSARPTKTRSKKGEGGSRSHSISNVYREEEGSDEDGAISLNAIKNKYKGGASAVAKGGAIYSSDEEGSDIENRRSRKQDKTKALKDSDTSEESDDE